MPDVFGADSKAFDEAYGSSVGAAEKEAISQLHKILKPFILRRLKVHTPPCSMQAAGHAV